MYRMEMLWRGDLDRCKSGAHLIIHLAIKASGPALRAFSTQYIGKKREAPNSRKMSDLLAALDKDLSRSPHEIALSKITLWAHFSRKPTESIRAYWLRLANLGNSLLKSGISFPLEVVFYRAIGGLNLAHPQLGLILSTIDARGGVTSVSDLGRPNQGI